MFTIKRPTIIVVLMVLLVLTGYINHRLTQQSALKASEEYQEHEENEMMSELDDAEKELVEALSETDDEEDGQEDRDEAEPEAEDISDLTEETDSSIETTISKENNLSSENYFIEHRLSRDKLRANLIDRLNKMVDNNKTDNEVRSQAQKEIIRLGELSEKELQLEGLIKAKGFDEALVFLKEDEARVIISTDELLEQDVVKILEVVRSETDLDTRQIKIMEKD